MFEIRRFHKNEILYIGVLGYLVRFVEALFSYVSSWFDSRREYPAIKGKSDIWTPT
jgi:hypothetical protein